MNAVVITTLMWALSLATPAFGNTWEQFARTRSALSALGVPDESDLSPALLSLAKLQTVAGAREMLPFLDLAKEFPRYSRLNGQRISVFQDVDSLREIDFEIMLRGDEAPPVALPEFHRRLSQAAQALRPLDGLRIALDPGHMGGDEWDERTTKFVRDKRGTKLSEGILTLQTALLLERQLIELGAEVFLTRRSIAPVTSLDYKTFDFTPFAFQALHQSVLDPWFVSTMQLSTDGSALASALRARPEMKELFSESGRSTYFILYADLIARAEAISAFKPDLTIVIHFDTSPVDGDPYGVNLRGRDGTKAYVAGAFAEGELVTREDRHYFAQHLFNPYAWKGSVSLSQSILSALQKDLGLPLDRSGGGGSVREVVPGVFSRNLHLTRKLVGHPVSYLECLFYNDAKEFAALSTADDTIVIDGAPYPYSTRLMQVVNAIKTGIVRFVSRYAS